MPRKEYKTITVKVGAFQKFTNAIKKAKKENPDIDNSEFLISLISKNQKIKRNNA